MCRFFSSPSFYSLVQSISENVCVYECNIPFALQTFFFFRLGSNKTSLVMKFLKLWFISVSKSMAKKRHNIHFALPAIRKKFNRKDIRLRGWISIYWFVCSVIEPISNSLCTLYTLHFVCNSRSVCEINENR